MLQKQEVGTSRPLSPGPEMAPSPRKKFILYESSPVVQRLRLRTSTAGGTGLIPGQGTKISEAAWHGQKKKRDRNGAMSLLLYLIGHGPSQAPP